MSERITNLMAADVFFNRKISSRYRNRVEKERFTLQPVKAKRIMRSNALKDKHILQSDAEKNEQKYVKPSSRGIKFTERQLQIAVAALVKGKQ